MKELSTAEIRPYYDPDNFQSEYPYVFKHNYGVINQELGKPISMTLPTTIKHNNQKPYNMSRNNLGISAVPVNKTRTAKIQEDMFDYNSVKELLTSVLKNFIKKYLRNLISQPFEVARLLLQVGVFPKHDVSNKEHKVVTTDFQSSDDEDIEYLIPADTSQSSFESSNNLQGSISVKPKSRSHRRFSSIETAPPTIEVVSVDEECSKYKLNPFSLNTLDVISSLFTQDGVKGMFRALNTTFIYNTLFATIEAWISGFISPLLSIPDPYFVDVIHSSDPSKALVLILAASVVTAVILQPIELINVRFMVTPTNKPETNRSFRSQISQYSPRDFLCPWSLLLPTINHSLASNGLKRYIPYLLFTQFNMDIYNSPVMYPLITLVTNSIELFIRLPVETLLRRAQLNYLLNNPNCNKTLRLQHNELSVPFGGYYGYFSTLYYVYTGSKPSFDKVSVTELNNINRGLESIFRGWKVGLLHVLSNWRFQMLNNYTNVSEEQF
ncbi:hypothetical protein LJB42_003906 [Komagataella kurtzmanii]|nr:hypothetical protein LJB42_003906 [Komagataella kurtzmanii]